MSDDIFTEPITAQSLQDDFEWERSIELKISNQGKMIIGLGAGVLVVLALTGLQGKVVIRLVKANAMVVEAVNALSNAISPTNPDSMVHPDSKVSYTEPSKTVETPEPNEQELQELRDAIKDSTSVDIDSFLNYKQDEGY